MDSNKFPHLEKCGEILIDIRSKNKKSKIFVFHCIFCQFKCNQLKKFSLHFEEHLNYFEDILKKTALKLEAETEEIELPAYPNTEISDSQFFESPIETKVNINDVPSNTVTTSRTATISVNVNSKVKCETVEYLNVDNAADIGGTVSIRDSARETDDKSAEIVPFKRRSLNGNSRKGKKSGQKHAEVVLKETVVKFEAEPEEIQVPLMGDMENADMKIFDYSIEPKTNVNTYLFDTVNTSNSASNSGNLNYEFENEIIESSFDGTCAKIGSIDRTFSISDKDNETSYKTDSDDDYIEEMSFKKRKTNKNYKKCKIPKRKESTIKTSCNEYSDDAEHSEKKTKLSRAEVQKRYRAKLKQDEKRYEEYKQKARERSSKQLKRGEMSLQMLKLVRAKAMMRYYKKM